MKKYSRQREAVYEAVCSVRSHPTADEVYDSVKKKLPNVSLATVYRNLSLLCSEGKLIMINTGDGATHYDGFTEKHHHLVCSVCGKVVDLDLSVSIDLSASGDCEIDDYNIIFYGKCRIVQNCDSQIKNFKLGGSKNEKVCLPCLRICP